MLVNQKYVGTIAPMAGLPAVLTDWAISFGQLMAFSQRWVCGPDQQIALAPAPNSLHDVARNQIAKAAVGEWVLFLDTDHKFSPDILFRMVRDMRRANADAVTALYLQRFPPYLPNIWKLRDDGHDTYGDWPRGEILRVDCAGAGCLLVRRQVFQRIWDELGEEPFSRLEFQAGTNLPMGEDFAFFRRMKRLGMRTICPTYIECPHIEQRPLHVDEVYDPTRLDDQLIEVPVEALRIQTEGVAA